MLDATPVQMPRLADTLVEGTVARWLKRAGEPVAAGEPLVQIETDKVSTELNAPASGVLLEVVVAEGQTVPVDTVIARIGSGEPADSTPTALAPPESDEQATSPAEAPRATPVARRLLQEHGLSPAQIDKKDGTRLTKQDVLDFVTRAAAARPLVAGDHPSPARSSSVQPLGQMRRAIAEHMTRARTTIPHGLTVASADLTTLAAWRESEKDAFQTRSGAGLTYTVLFVAALGRALARRAGRLGLPVPASGVDVGVAVALESGLIVPVVRGADRLTLEETARTIRDLAERARSRELALEETHGAIMTVTNVGSFGNLTASPIVPLEQLGILGPGVVERRPMPTADGGIRLGWQCLMALVFDRRAFSDLAADRFLAAVVEELRAFAATQVGS